MKRDILPSTSVLRCFEAAAKHQSYTAASEELQVTQGAISRQIRELETMLGVKLFRREGRGIALTDAGRSFAERLAPDLERIRQSVIMTRAAGQGGKMLSIAVLPTFATRWLVPRLPDFQKHYPDVQLTFHSRAEPFDLVAEGIDLAIQFGREEWGGITLTELGPEDLAVVASPELVARLPVNAPKDLARLPRLHLLSRKNAWNQYFSDLGLSNDTTMQGTLFDQFSTMIAAAIQGMGAAIVPSYLIEQELTSGSLQVLGRPKAKGQSYYVATRSGEINLMAEAFKTWIRREARTSLKQRRTAV
jgi:DNA-binding transcriptional LysR family regulator